MAFINLFVKIEKMKPLFLGGFSLKPEEKEFPG